MGGIICNIHRQAVLEFQTVPTDVKQLPEFDAQIRELYNAPSIAESVVNDAADKALQVCATLAKPSFTQADREFLYGVIESLYEPYP